MNQSDIAALMKGIAPALHDLVMRTVQPLVDRIGELEAELAEEREAREAPQEFATAERVAALEMRLEEATRAPEPPTEEERAARDEAFLRAVVAASQKSSETLLAGFPKPEPLPDIPALVQQKVAEAMAAIPVPKDGEPGKDADPADVERLVTETVERVLESWGKPKDGTSVTAEDVAPLIDEAVSRAIAELPPAEPGKEGPAGKLPVAREWADGVTYEADVRTHKGALWQAIRDTGKEPGGDDWICLAAPGKDADEIEIRGTYDAEVEYRRLNIVALNGGAFIARKNDPGPCPGEGWQVVAMRGKPGEKGATGPRGDRGDSGPAGPGVLHLQADDQGLFTLVNGDGSTVEVDLYPLLSKLGNA